MTECPQLVTGVAESISSMRRGWQRLILRARLVDPRTPWLDAPHLFFLLLWLAVLLSATASYLADLERQGP